MKKVYVVMWQGMDEYDDMDFGYWGIYSSLDNALKSIPEHCDNAPSDNDRLWIESCELDGTKCSIEVGSKSVKEWLKELN